MIARNWTHWLAPLAAFLLVFPCRAESFPDYPVRVASEYPISLTKAGLTIAAHPIEPASEQKTYFNAELTPKGYLPVLIVMQNASTDNSFLFSRSGVKYRLLNAAESSLATPEVHSKVGEALPVAGAAAGGIASAVVAGSIVGGSGLLAPVNLLAMEVLAVPLLLPVLLPLAIVAGQSVSKAERIQQNLVKRALQSKTLSPGASAHGFLYVPVPKGSTRQRLLLNIPVTRTSNEEALDFDLVF